MPHPCARTALAALSLLVSTVGVGLAPGVALAATYRVGPGETFRQLSELPALDPGDVVEVMGGAEYDGDVVFDFDWDGTAAMPITVRGIPDGSGARPRIVGGDNTIELQGDHYVLENLDISGGARRCVFHHAHEITIRDTVVHDCPAQGILGADTDSGSLTLERVEVHHCGGGTFDHQIYMATDETAHPGAIFRMQGCWVHDANGGNSVKSRAERNEIYFNWIEGGTYHELELIGPDPSGGAGTAAREDSDVVGNVLVKRGDNENFAVVRFGGDGTGESDGRYRFAFNTVLVAPGATAAVFRLFDGLASVEMHSNVFLARDGGPVNLLREVEADWTGGSRLVAGTNNWVATGSTNVPPEWTGTIEGAAPGLVETSDLAALDPSPASDTSPLVGAGLAPPPVFLASPFPSPLEVPGASPIHGPGSVPRPVVGTIDIGAYEHGSGPPPFDAGPSGTDGGPADAGGSSTDAGGTSGLDGGGSGTDGGPSAPTSTGCACRVGRAHGSHAGAAASLALLTAALLARGGARRARRRHLGRDPRARAPEGGQ